MLIVFNLPILKTIKFFFFWLVEYFDFKWNYFIFKNILYFNLKKTHQI